MIKNINGTFLVMVITMLSSFVTTIILGKTLSIEAFGEFALLKQIILVGSSIAIFGLDFSYIKLFSKNHNSSLKLHLITIIIVSLVNCLFMLVLYSIYDFQLYKLLALFLCIYFCAINLYQAAIYRLKGQFILAQLFAEGWKFILLLLIILVIYSGIEISLQLIYQIFTVSAFIFSSYIIRKFYKTINISNENIEYKQYLTLGLIFWLINSTGLIYGGIDKLVIPILFGTEALGVYTGASFVFVISLTMIGSAIGYVIYPLISAGKEINLMKLFLAVIFIILLAMITFQLTGAGLVSILFSGKFDSFINNELIFCFTLLGSFQIVHIILHFILSAIGSKKQLIYYWLLSILFIVITIMLLHFIKADYSFNLFNISFIILLSQFGKIISMIILVKYADNKRNNIAENINYV